MSQSGNDVALEITYVFTEDLKEIFRHVLEWYKDYSFNNSKDIASIYGWIIANIPYYQEELIESLGYEDINANDSDSNIRDIIIDHKEEFLNYIKKYNETIRTEF